MTSGDFPGGIAPPKVRVSEAALDNVSVLSGEDSDVELNVVEEEDQLGDLCEGLECQLPGSDNGDILAMEDDDGESMSSVEDAGGKGEGTWVHMLRAWTELLMFDIQMLFHHLCFNFNSNPLH